MTDQGANLDIAVCFDTNYALHAASVVTSLVRNSSLDATRIFCLGSEVGNDLMSKLVDRGNACFQVVPLDTDDLADYGGSSDDALGYLSPAMFLRLQLPWLVPPDCTRLLYLDCDTLCTGSLRALNAWDLGPAVVGAVRDPGVVQLGRLSRLVGAGAQDRDAYFNSGVLLIDVARWRESEITERCSRVLAGNREGFRYPDQDALNVVLSGLWSELPRRFNELEAWKLEDGYSFPVVDVSVVHCAGTKKFWDSDFPEGFRRSTYDDCAGMR